jgi:hypothetical protein
MHNFSFCFKVREFARFKDQCFIKFNVRPAHKRSMHQLTLL